MSAVKRGEAQIVHIVRDLNADGVQRVLLGTLPLLDPSVGRHAILCLQEIGSCADELETRGIEVHALPGGRAGGLGGVLALRRWLRRSGVRCVHCHWPDAYLAVGLAVRGLGCACVMHVHCLMDEFWRLTPLPQRLLGKALVRRADRIVAVSETVRRDLQRELGCPPERIEVIENGVTLPELRSDRDELRTALKRNLGIPPQRRVVGIIARLSRAKRHGDFIEAAALVRRQEPEVSFVVVGRGKDKYVAKLNDAIAREGMNDAVRWVGEQRDVEPYLYGFDVGVLCSEREGFGLALMEYLAYELPVVVTRIPAFEEVIRDGDNGLLAEVRDPASLAQGILRVLRDPDLARRLSRNGRAGLSGRGWSQTAARLNRLYKELLG